MRVLCSATPASGRQHALGSSQGVRRPVPAAVGAVRRPLPVRRCSAVTPLGGAVKPQRSGFMDDVEYSDWQEDEYVVHDDAVPDTFQFSPEQRVKLRITPQTLEKAARRAKRDFIYEHTLSELCIELVKLQEYVKAKGLKMVAIFEGRDAAGKGGVISRIASAMSPRICRVVALSAPNERERTQWYFQRYVAHLPAAGEIVLFDRSWYNRAGVENVMGFCSAEQYEQFVAEVPVFEKMLTDSGIVLVKYWLDVSDHEQEIRFEGRLHRSWKRWKLSPMDLFARSRWTEYARARDAMLQRTDSPHAPWLVVPSDDKKAARLNCISDLLSRIPYEEIHPPRLALPPRDSAESHPEYGPYTHPPVSAWRYVKPLYNGDNLSVLGALQADGTGDDGGSATPVNMEAIAALMTPPTSDEEDDDHFVGHAGDD